MPQLIDIPGHGQVEFPDGMSDEAIASAIKRNLMVGTAPKKNWLGFSEANPETKAAIDKAKNEGWGSGWPKFAYDLGGQATDLTGSPGVGLAANVLTQAVPTLLTMTSGIGKPLLEGPAKWLLQTAVKPSTKDLETKAADKALSTMLQENIYPTRAGMDKASQITSKLNQQVEEGIAGSTASVNVGDVASRLEEPMQKFGMQVNPKADTTAIENAWTEFLTSQHIAGKTDIPVQLAHDLKKGTYASLGGKSYGEVGSASTEAQKALARGLREEVGDAVPSILEPLKREAALLNVKDVAAHRALLQGNNNPMGLGALRLGDNPLSTLSFMADRWPAFKAFLAMQMYGGSKPGMLLPLGMEANPETVKASGLYGQ